MLDREGLTRGYGRAAINSVAWEHAQLRDLLKEAHECLQDYRRQTELSTSVDKLLFRLEATKPRE